MSGPFDKHSGRQADPEGGEVYDKGSAWAGAHTEGLTARMPADITARIGAVGHNPSVLVHSPAPIAVPCHGTCKASHTPQIVGV